MTFACRASKFSFGRVAQWGGGNRSAPRHDLDSAHHAAVFVLEDVAVVEEGADDVGIAEIHPQPNAGVAQHPAVEVGHVHRVAQEGLVDRHAGPFA